jgi:inosose dehydratase
MITRRTALKQLAVASLGLPLAAAPAGLLAADTVPSQKSTSLRAKFRLGVATVGLKSLPLDNMLAAVQRVGLDHISLFRAHSPWENSPARWAEIAQKIRASGVTPLCCGVLYLKNDEPAMRRMFDYAKTLGVTYFSCSLEPAALPLLEKLVKEYDLRAAIHNHGPEDKVWPSPDLVWQAIQPLDKRIGLCLDVGHAWRAGTDPAAAIRAYRERLYDVHLKDSAAAVGQEDVPVEVGRGHIDQRALLTALMEIDYRENVWFEYEKDANDPVPGLAESIGYIRGLLHGMGAA